MQWLWHRESFDSSHSINGSSEECVELAALGHLDQINYFLFWAILMKLLLLGCKTRSMQKTLLNKLEVFLHHNIQRILRVWMTKVREDRIKNKHVRWMFYDIHLVSNVIPAHQLNFIRKTIRGPFDRPAQQMLTACCDNIWWVGCLFLHNKGFIVKTLRLQMFQKSPLMTMAPSRTGFGKHLDNIGTNVSTALLIGRQAMIPAWPDDWPQPWQSPQNHNAPPHHKQPFPSMPPRTRQLHHTMMPEPNEHQCHQVSAPLTTPLPFHYINNGWHLRPHMQMKDETTYLSRWDIACMIPSRFLDLDLEPLEREVKLAYRD